MSKFKIFISAILAGFCIGLGGTAFLSLDNKVLGALFFTVGLFTICSFGFHLFTGKVCYIFDNDGAYVANLPIIWVGNVIGTGITAGLLHLTRVAPALSDKAKGLCEAKLNDNFLSLFILGIFCNIFIYIAVEGFANHQHQIGKYLSLFFGVMVFILCGFEHCVADMFYFWMGAAWNGRAVLAIIVISLGNAAGGVLLPVIRKRIKA